MVRALSLVRRDRVCIFWDQNVAGLDLLEMSKPTVWLLHRRSCNSVAWKWKLYVATPADAKRCSEAAKYNVLKVYQSVLKMFLGSVADVFYILTVLRRGMFLVFENAR